MKNPFGIRESWKDHPPNPDNLETYTEKLEKRLRFLGRMAQMTMALFIGLVVMDVPTFGGKFN